jgi:chromosome segregation ATPase
LIEHELDGLLRRRIEYSSKDYEGGTRTLDFTNLLNEKEYQIVELEKKIQNLEERLRRSSAREIELENKIIAFRAENLTLRDKSLTGQKLDDAMRRESQFEQSIKDLEALRSNFSTAASVWKNQISKITSKYPNERYELDYEITSLLQRANIQSYNSNGISTIEVHS